MTQEEFLHHVFAHFWVRSHIVLSLGDVCLAMGGCWHAYLLSEQGLAACVIIVSPGFRHWVRPDLDFATTSLEQGAGAAGASLYSEGQRVAGKESEFRKSHIQFCSALNFHCFFSSTTVSVIFLRRYKKKNSNALANYSTRC